ncbi:4Fe-4S ferredoxin [Effusibacillus lacus]|uniref:4Fe-4S ferredoxin n=1 Tax=Effusibacillus lacus TaxID=1348429 RepID=A0A292YLB3_9BACL|nr:4Fe-4S ferredoxin [Effusibacillus lacus]
MEKSMGMLIDTSTCHGCKACQVACKEWNGLPMEQEIGLTGISYDNTGHLSDTNWRHVKFVELFSEDRSDSRWLFLSDSCKHCQLAGCMEVCPTNAIIRTEFDTVYIDQDTCIGCRYCITGCPFGVIEISHISGTAQKCTLCYDRLQVGQQPACAQACPTDCIQFGEVPQLMQLAEDREKLLKNMGYNKAQIYGKSDILNGLNVFYLLLEKPEVYGLPTNPQLPQKNMMKSYMFSIAGMVAAGVLALLAFRSKRMVSKPVDSDKDQSQVM